MFKAIAIYLPFSAAVFNVTLNGQASNILIFQHENSQYMIMIM